VTPPSEEIVAAVAGAIAAAIGNVYVIIRSQKATEKATRAVVENTEATGSQRKVTIDLATKAEENYAMMKDVLAEYRVMAKSDRDASLSKAVDNVWQTRERVLLARHNETMDLLHHILETVKGAQPRPLLTPAPEAHGITNLPPLDSDPRPVPDREKSP
jgi:hypothetical protein